MTVMSSIKTCVYQFSYILWHGEFLDFKEQSTTQIALSAVLMLIVLVFMRRLSPKKALNG